MGIVVNRAWPSLHGGFLEITLTVPLSIQTFKLIHGLQIKVENGSELLKRSEL